jgi:hypothetical protein
VVWEAPLFFVLRLLSLCGIPISATHFYSYAHTTLFVSLARVYIHTHTHTHTHTHYRKGLRAHREQLFCSVFAKGVVERKKRAET